MKKPSLSKSKIKNNDSCNLRLFNEVFYPEQQKYDTKTQKAFGIGHLVDQEAKSRFLGGVEVKAWSNLDRAKETQELIDKGTNVIFEASFIGDDTAIRTDVLLRNDDGTFDMIEVKSSSKVKEDYLDDLTIQYHAIKASQTIIIRKALLWHINSKAKTKKDIFKEVDLTNQVIKNKPRYKNLLKSAIKTVNTPKDQPPEKILGPKCHNCPFKSKCWNGIESNPAHVLNLPGFDHRWQAYEKNIETLNDPRFLSEYPAYSQNYSHRIKAIIEKRGSFLKDKIKPIINSWKFPIYFLDFETINAPIPNFSGYKPYENVLVQYSLNILNEDNSQNHKEFLHSSFEPPEILVCDRILSDIGEEGTIVTYSKSFEISQLKSLSLRIDDPIKKEKLLNLISRIVDLLDVIEPYIYHPDFMGSFGLKTVVPVLLKNDGYKNLPIKDGSEVASNFYEMVTTDNDTKRKVIRNQLLKYCEKDTQSLVDLFIWIKEMCK